MTKEMKVGDRVQIKGGYGPEMIVEQIGSDFASCLWLINNEFHREAFRKGLIETVKVKEPT